jgi:glycerol-3-phosphate O-acyltransferase
MRPYAPNPLLERIYHRFFRHMRVEETWVRAIREASKKGTVVYIQRNLSFVDFLALDYLTKREGLPPVHFANDLGLFVLEPMGRGWLQAVRRSLQGTNDAGQLEQVLLANQAAALFLKRPTTLFEPGARGRIEGDAFLQTLLRVQRKQERPLILCPQVFVWSRNPDQAQTSNIDLMLGPREWPGKLRTVAQFLGNYRDVTIRLGEPLNLKEALALERESEASSDASQIRRLTFTLLRRMERERRTVTGPVHRSYGVPG